MNLPSAPLLTVYYNTRCPVCDTGINRQKNKLLRAVKAGDIEFRDINLEPDALAAHGASLDMVRKKLHARDAQGRLFVGTSAFAEIWRRTPGEVWLATLISLPGIRWLAHHAYNLLAECLYAWNRRKGRW
ncbi:DUF393 domain-containing protein [bacterium]|nr:DUF393 domain-containing protein [bacterium]